MAFFHGSGRTSDAASQQAGVVASVKHLAGAGARYVDARMRLLALETKLLVGELKVGAILLAVAAVLGVIALLLAVTALVLWLSTVLPQGNGALACGIVAGVFLLLAGLLAWRGLQSFKGRNVYPATKSELTSDKQWLKEL